MSRLAQMMAAKKAQAAKKAPAPKLTKEPAKEIADPVLPKEEAKPTSFKAPAKSTVGALNEISTQLSEAISDADKKVQEQTEKGVYNLSDEAKEVLGTDAEHLVLTMQQLDAALVEKTPDIRTLSYEIRKNLEQYPELVHILSDEQLAIMVSGYLTIANVKTAPKTKAAKSAAASKKADATIKSLASKGVDELF